MVNPDSVSIDALRKTINGIFDFIEKDLGPEGMKRSVVVVATSDTSAPLRLRAASTVPGQARERLPRSPTLNGRPSLAGRSGRILAKGCLFLPRPRGLRT